jgi:hypothetical protein
VAQKEHDATRKSGNSQSQIGSVGRDQDEAAARSSMALLLAELNSGRARIGSSSITVAQLCDHFEQRELAKDNTWRSYSTKKTYHAYLTRWVLPHEEMKRMQFARCFHNA